MAFIPENNRQEPQSSPYQALHAPLKPRGTGATSPSSGFFDYDSIMLPPQNVGKLETEVLPVYASERTIVSSEFNRRLLVLIGGFTYSHSVYHAAAASPTGPIDPTSLSTYQQSAGGAFTVGTLGTTFGQHEYWESWEYGVHAIDCLTQTLSRSAGIEVKIGLFEMPVIASSYPPKAGNLVPSGKSTPAAMPAAAATAATSGGPTVAEWTTMFESLHASPGFGNTNLTFANKSMFLQADEVLLSAVTVIHSLYFGQHMPLRESSSGTFWPNSFIGSYLVFNYGDHGATFFPSNINSDRARWWNSAYSDTSWQDPVFGVTAYQEPHHILYSIAAALRNEAFGIFLKDDFPDRNPAFTSVQPNNVQMRVMGFPPADVQVTAGSTTGQIDVSWTGHIAAPDDGVESRWRIYVTTDSSVLADLHRLRNKGALFTTENLRNGLQVVDVGAISKINTPGYKKTITVDPGLAGPVVYYVTMTNRHFNGYLLRASRGILTVGGAPGAPQQGQVEITESDAFTPFRTISV